VSENNKCRSYHVKIWISAWNRAVRSNSDVKDHFWAKPWSPVFYHTYFQSQRHCVVSVTLS
jgi:hypothetical protein